LIDKLLASDLLVHIFVENLDIKHPKMSPIPLGLLKNNISIDNDDFHKIDFSIKNTLCFIRNRVHDDGHQWDDRKKAFTLSKNEWGDFVKCIDKEITHEEFIEEIKKSKFCLCIHGGGYDPCPKFFECI